MFMGESGAESLATPGFFPEEKIEEDVRQGVFLPGAHWDELAAIAKFETEIRRSLGLKSFSRARLLKHIVARYIADYWPGVGGKPTSQQESRAMAKREAERRLEEQRAADTATKIKR